MTSQLAFIVGVVLLIVAVILWIAKKIGGETFAGLALSGIAFMLYGIWVRG